MKKPIIYVIPLLLLTSCAVQPVASESSKSSIDSSGISSSDSSESSTSTSSSSSSSTSSSSSVPIIPPSYDCFTVELISKDDYKTNEFSQVFTNYKEKNDVTYTSDNPALSVSNVMPHNVVDTYGVALFTVRTTDHHFHMLTRYRLHLCLKHFLQQLCI